MAKTPVIMAKNERLPMSELAEALTTDVYDEIDKEIERLTKGNPEVRTLHAKMQAIEEEAKYDKKHFANEEAQKTLRDILWSGIAVEKELKKENTVWRDQENLLFESAQKYLDTPSLHTPFLTRFLLSRILDTTIIPLEAEAVGKVVRGGFNPFLHNYSDVLFPWPWNKLVAAVLSLVFISLGVVFIRFLASSDLIWAAWIVGILMAWHYGWKVIRAFKVGKIRSKVAGLGLQLKMIRDEINSGAYVGSVLTERLRQCEKETACVHSIVYPLLALKA